MIRPLALLLVALALAACDLDFVGPPAGEPARLSLSVTLHDRAALAPISLYATLHPGTDARGQPRVVEDEHLRGPRLDVAPAEVIPGGQRVYHAGWSMDPAAFDQPIVELSAPRVRGLEHELPTLRWYAMRRAGPEAITLAPGQDLVLPIWQPAAQPEPAPTLYRWALDLTTAEGRTFSLRADARAASSLRIPAEWLPESRSGEIEASLTLYQWAITAPQPTGYAIYFALSNQLHWSVRVVDSSTP